MWRDAKRIGFIFALGLGTGGYLAQMYYENVLSFADRGYCAQRDPAKTRYWFNCLDGAVALELQQRDRERDASLVGSSDPIGDIIRATETEAKKAKPKVTKVKQ